jgi:hypothetical protein
MRGLLAVCFLVLGADQLLSLSNDGATPVQFNNLREFRRFVESNGLSFHNGTRDPGVFTIHGYVGDHPLTFDRLPALARAPQHALGAEWRGIVRVTWCLGPAWQYDLPTDWSEGTWRVWGNLIALGDQDLLDRIEELYRRQERPLRPS